jgi:hypothetical protein
MKLMTKNLDWLAEIPSGWADLYTALVTNLEKSRATIEVQQAKQKFGELRVYVDRGSDEIYELIDAATKRSRSTCEVCGTDAVLRDMKGFFSTRCDEHADGHAPAAAKPIAASFRIFGGKIYQTDR